MVDEEKFPDFLTRIATKSGLDEETVKAVKERKDGAGVVYEFEGGRWSLEDGSS